MVRAAHPGDVPAIRRVDWASAQPFRAYGLEAIADDEPVAAQLVRDYVEGARAWVVSDADEVVGFVLVDRVDDGAHVEQVCVVPEHQGRGLGRALIERAIQWAAERDRHSVTLTTFTHIPWNRPLYEHLGFHVVEVACLGPELAARRSAEAARGLDPSLRVVMQLDLVADRPHP